MAQTGGILSRLSDGYQNNNPISDLRNPLIISELFTSQSDYQSKPLNLGAGLWLSNATLIAGSSLPATGKDAHPRRISRAKFCL